jgi:signal transduction histidine kinase
MGIIADITQRKRLEELLRQAQKMEALGRLAGGIAHDFKNLLTVIMGRSELALSHLASGDLRRHDLGLIQTTAHRAAALTAQLLAFSRRQVLSRW